LPFYVGVNPPPMAASTEEAEAVVAAAPAREEAAVAGPAQVRAVLPGQVMRAE